MIFNPHEVLYQGDAQITGAVQNTRQVVASTGLTGGGSLTSDVTVALSSATVTSLGKADTALQSTDTGTSGHKLGYLDGINTVSAVWNFTSAPTVPDQTAGNNSSKTANTKYVDTGLALKLTASNPVCTGPLIVPAYTVSGLPSATTPYQRAFVTDATTPTWGSTVTGGGSTKCPVWSNGTNWIVG